MVLGMNMKQCFHSLDFCVPFNSLDVGASCVLQLSILPCKEGEDAISSFCLDSSNLIV